MRFLFVLLLFLTSFQGMCQEKKSIRVTGIAVNANTLDAVPFVSIILKNGFRGTVSDNSGYFSFLANASDTIIFSAVGYRESTFVVPALLQDDQYSLIQLLVRDTILLKEVMVYPWPDLEQFTEAFLNLELKKNLSDRSFKAQNELTTLLAKENKKEQFSDEQISYSKLYNTTGIVPPNNFLNPINWANFIRDWKRGKFDKKR